MKGESLNGLVSVIIPAFNVERYIAVCLDRICGQTYSNIEIIIVDDGSTDGTLEVCNRFSNADKRIKIVKTSHCGVSGARNLGLSSVSGDYVVFIDSDDFVKTNIIEEYIDAFDCYGHEIAIAISGMVWENRQSRFAPIKNRLLDNKLGYEEGKKYLLERHETSQLAWLKLFNFITNKCYKSSVIRDGNIRFDENISIAEDMKFNIDYLNSAAGKFCVVNKPLYHYVKHGSDSLSGRYYDGAIGDVKKSYKMLLDFTCNQDSVTTDDVYVIKSIFLMDWVSRLCALWDDNFIPMSKREKLDFANDEIRSIEFKRLLRDSKMGKKITRYRFYTLVLGQFGVFIYLRKLYQWIKRIKGKEDNGDTMDH